MDLLVILPWFYLVRSLLWLFAQNLLPLFTITSSTESFSKLLEKISPSFHVETVSSLSFSSFLVQQSSAVQSLSCYWIETSSLSCIRIETSHSFIMGAMEKIKVRFVWSSNPRVYIDILYTFRLTWKNIHTTHVPPFSIHTGDRGRNGPNSKEQSN